MASTTDIWQGQIHYGPFEGSLWLGISDISHPLFKSLITDLKGIEHFKNGYNLYIFGGVLEDWLSWDIDMAITGEYNPEILKDLMHRILEISFNRAIYIDLKYILSHNVFDFNEWLLDEDFNMLEYHVVEYSDSFVKNGVSQEFNKIEHRDGLWHRKIYLPSSKQLSKYEQGYKYKSPIQII